MENQRKKWKSAGDETQPRGHEDMGNDEDGR